MSGFKFRDPGMPQRELAHRTPQGSRAFGIAGLIAALAQGATASAAFVVSDTAFQRTITLDSALTSTVNAEGKWEVTDGTDTYTIPQPDRSSEYLAIALEGADDTAVPEGLIDSGNGSGESLASEVPQLPVTFTLDLADGIIFEEDGSVSAGSAGTVNTGRAGNDAVLRIELADGLNVIDIETGESNPDIFFENVNFLIDGSENASAIFRYGGVGFDIQNANILSGSSGIGLNSILFFTRATSTRQTLEIDNAVLNGIAFYDLGLAGGAFTIEDSQGCTQFIADRISFDKLGFNRCGFGSGRRPPADKLPGAPVPPTMALVGVGLGMLSLGLRRRKNRH
jgi:hypothetical protein